MSIQSEPSAPLGPLDVRIRSVVSGISQGTEMLVYRGQVPPDMELDLPTLQGGFDFPIKYGYASVGRVLEIGTKVRDLTAGSTVFALHPHQTEYVAPASHVVPLPDGLRPEVGVFTANVETAVNVVLDTHPRLGDCVIIFGQGVVGLLIAQVARMAGAALVLAVEPSARRRQLALEAGVDAVLEPGAGVAEAVRELTDGRGADVAIEASGNGDALAAAIECVTFQGTVAVCSWYGAKPVSLSLGGTFHRGRVRIVSSQVGSLDPALGPAWTRERRLALAVMLLRRLRLEPLITHRFPFHRAAEAFAFVDNNAGEAGQTILTYGEDDV